jgi:signal transduction histidine kinase/DNA-binding response OmpR family regulator
MDDTNNTALFSERRAKIVAALNKAIETFIVLKGDSFARVMADGIAPIADAAGVDRVAIYNFRDKEDVRHLGQIYRWDRKEGSEVSLNDFLMDLPNNEVTDTWMHILSNNGYIFSRRSGMTEAERNFTEPFGIQSILLVPIFSYGEFWGTVSFQNHTTEADTGEGCMDLIRSAANLCANALIRESVYQNSVESFKALERSKKMADIVNNTAVIFLSNSEKTFEEMMTIGVGAIADIAGLDRLSVWRNSLVKGTLHTSQIYRWDRAAGGTTRATPGLIDTTYDKLAPRWKELLARGETINSPICLLPEAAMLKSFGVVSAFITPIFIGGNFWGFVLFEDRHNERYFESDCTEMMRLAAFLFANTVMRVEMDRNLREQDEQLKIRLEQQELVSDIAKSFVTSGESETLINEAVARLGRYLGTSRIVILGIDYEHSDTYIAYSWHNENLPPPHQVIPGALEIINAGFPETLQGDTITPTISCDDISRDAFYGRLESAGMLAFVCAPLYVEGYLWGMISVEQCDRKRRWLESEKSFIAMIASVIAGAIMHSIYNDRLKKALARATAASEAKGVFLSNMSHEMRTPMNTIMGMASIGKNSPNLERKDYALGKIEEASSHLLGVINDVLDMSKIEANKLEIVLADFSFEKMLKKSVNAICIRMEQKQQKFQVIIDGKIPYMLVGDDQRLTQVIINLLSNAVKFTPEGGQISLSAFLEEEKDGICTIAIEVSDTGIGISPEQSERLFNAFEQADSGTSRKFGGTGLGLVISKRIVEMMGGEIGVVSELGKGAKFRFSFKAERCKDSPGTLLDPSVNWETMKVLAVDDAEEVLSYFTEIFKRYGVSCDTAISGDAAMERIRETGGYDIYFVDWKMPGMNGIELSKQIKNFNKNKKAVVIMISATEWAIIRDEAEGAGIDKFLMKPLFASDIMDCMNVCLGVGGSSMSKRRRTVKYGEFKGCRILLAEDVEINREILLANMENTDVEIDCAENGVEALRLLAESPKKYDLVFMDVQMPEMDGLEAARRIRENGNKIPIIAMTANVFREDVERCLAAGMDDHIGKPLDMDNVFKKIRKYWKKNKSPIRKSPG